MALLALKFETSFNTQWQICHGPAACGMEWMEYNVVVYIKLSKHLLMQKNVADKLTWYYQIYFY